MKLVLILLADRANDDGECWPGLGSVSKDCNVSERTLMRYLDKMESLGLLSREKRKAENGRQVTNLYRLNLACKPGDNLSPGVDEPGDNRDTNRVTTVSPVLKEEPTVLTQSNTRAREVEQEPLLAKPVVFTGEQWQIDNAVFDTWIQAFQNGRTCEQTEDWIEQELAKAALWLQANSARRKKNYLKFLTGWLTRASRPSPFIKQHQRSFH